jgi:hypothetical protein
MVPPPPLPLLPRVNVNVLWHPQIDNVRLLIMKAAFH